MPWQPASSLQRAIAVTRSAYSPAPTSFVCGEVVKTRTSIPLPMPRTIVRYRAKSGLARGVAASAAWHDICGSCGLAVDLPLLDEEPFVRGRALHRSVARRADRPRRLGRRAAGR